MRSAFIIGATVSIAVDREPACVSLDSEESAFPDPDPENPAPAPASRQCVTFLKCRSSVARNFLLSLASARMRASFTACSSKSGITAGDAMATTATASRMRGATSCSCSDVSATSRSRQKLNLVQRAGAGDAPRLLASRRVGDLGRPLHHRRLELARGVRVLRGRARVRQVHRRAQIGEGERDVARQPSRRAAHALAEEPRVARELGRDRGGEHGGAEKAPPRAPRRFSSRLRRRWASRSPSAAAKTRSRSSPSPPPLSPAPRAAAFGVRPVAVRAEQRHEDLLDELLERIQRRARARERAEVHAGLHVAGAAQNLRRRILDEVRRRRRRRARGERARGDAKRGGLALRLIRNRDARFPRARRELAATMARRLRDETGLRRLAAPPEARRLPRSVPDHHPGRAPVRPPPRTPRHRPAGSPARAKTHRPPPSRVPRSVPAPRPRPRARRRSPLRFRFRSSSARTAWTAFPRVRLRARSARRTPGAPRSPTCLFGGGWGEEVRSPREPWIAPTRARRGCRWGGIVGKAEDATTHLARTPRRDLSSRRRSPRTRRTDRRRIRGRRRPSPLATERAYRTRLADRHPPNARPPRPRTTSRACAAML